MARLPKPGGDAGNWGDILNEYLKTTLNEDGTLRSDVVAEQNLSPAVRTKLNTSSTVADGSITTPKLADNVITNPKLAPGSVSNDKLAGNIAQSQITNLTSDLAAKADTSHTHGLSDLSDVSADSATNGQSLVFQGGQWTAATVDTGGTGVTDHGALDGLGDDDHPQYLNNTRGDVRYYTKSEVDAAVVSDHGELDGLDGDDHPQYLNNARGDARYYTKSEVDATTFELDDLTDVNTDGATDGQSLVFQGGQWAAATVVDTGGTGVTDHGALTGLADDDHPQYLNNTRGDVRYYTKSQVDDAIAGASGAVASVAGKTGAVTLVKADVGLGNVDNTSDANKPVSSATQTALNAKANTNHSHAVADVTGLQTALDAKASSSHTHAVSNVTGLQVALDSKAADNSVVHTSGNETVAGVKTFSASPVVPTPTTNTQATNKQYVDTAVANAGGGGGAVTLADMPAGSVIYAIGASTARPSSRADLCCMWFADSAPVNALSNDVWMNGA